MGQLFDSMTRGYAPLTTGREVRLSTGLEGLPFMDNGASGLAAQLLLGPQLQGLMGQHGMMPFGLGHDQNIYDLLRRRQFMQAQQETMQIAAEHDREGHMQTFRGLAALTNTPWGSQQRQAARALSETAVQFAPVLAQVAPDLLDQMGGMRGSATVMAQRMSVGSRYRIDPITGRMGQSAKTVGDMAGQFYEDIYRDGNLSEMKGISAGQLGGMYDELTRRGMLSAQQGERSYNTFEALQSFTGQNRRVLERAAANQGIKLPSELADLKADELDKLRGDSGVADKLRSFDAEKVKRSLKSYVDAVSAMRDIFGDNGRPNAPMNELIAGLEAMTQGGVGKMDTGRLNMMVRTTNDLARQSGMSLDTALMIQQHAATRATDMGINPLHAVQAMQGSVAWGSAFKAQGGAAIPAWDRFNADQMSQLDVNLRVQAAASEQANRLGAFMRVNDRVGGFQEGSAARAMAQAISTGQTEFLNPTTGKVQSTAMSDQAFTGMLMTAKGQGGAELRLSEGDIRGMLRERNGNEQNIHKYNIADQVRRQQPADANVWVSGKVHNSLRDRLISAGMNAADATRAADQASGKVVGRVSKLSHEEFAGDQTRTARMSEIIRDELNNTEAGQFLTKQGLGKEFHDMTAELTYSGVNGMIQRDPWLARFKSWQNIHATMHDTTMRTGQTNLMQAKFTSQIAEAMAPLGRGTVLQRAVQYLQNAGPDSNVAELIGQALGGVKNSDVNRELQEPLVAVQKAQAKLEELHTKLLGATDSREKESLQKQVELQQNSLKSNVSSLTTLAEKHGIISDQEALTTEDTSRAKDQLRRLTHQTQDLHALRGNFGFTGTPEELAHRNSISLVPEKSEIDAILTQANRGKQDKDPTYMSVRQAEAIATARRRADRFGLTTQDIDTARRALEPGTTDDRVIDLAFSNKYKENDVVTRKDIDMVMALPGNQKLSKEEARNKVLANREQENKGRWAEFWHSESGAQYRESSEQMLNSVNDVATKAIMSEKQMAKLGPLAIEKYQQLRGHEARMRTLALYHTSGDMAKLLAGDFNPGTSAEERKQLRHEVHSIQNQFGASINFFETNLGKAGRNWGNTDEVARKILNLPKTGPVADPANLAKTKRGVETAQLLDDTIVTSLKDRDKVSDRLKTAAESQGLTREELTKLLDKGTAPAGRKSAEFTPLSDAEQQKVNVARDNYTMYAKERSSVDKRIKSIDDRLADPGLDNKAKQELQLNRAELDKERTKKTESMRSAMATIAPIAEARGTTPIGLAYERKGSMSAESLQTAREDLAKYRSLETDLTKKATDLKIDGGITGLNEGYAVLKKVAEQTKQFQGLENTDTKAMVNKLFATYGLDTTKHSDRIAGISRAMGDDVGRTFIRQLIGTGTQLQDVARRGQKIRSNQAAAAVGAQKERLQEEAARLVAGPDDPMKGVVAMAKEYEGINETKRESERETKLKQFRADFGIRSDDEFTQVKNALRFQMRKGILDAGDVSLGDSDKQAERLSHGIETMVQGRELGYHSNLSEDQYREMKMEMTGRLEVVGTHGEITGHAVTQKGN